MNKPAEQLQVLEQEEVKERIWTKDFILICTANFFIFLAFQITLPTLPLFVNELGGNQQLVGLVVGIFTISALLIRPMAGHALESKGRRLVYLSGLIIFILSMGSYSIAGSIIFLLIMRIVQGLGWGLSNTASGTIATDLIPASRRGEGLGFFGLSGNFALAIGPSLGLFLTDYISFKTLFLICAFLGFASFVLSSLISFGKIETKKEKSVAMKKDFYEKSALKPSLLLFFITVTFGGISSFLPVYAEQKGIDGIHWYFTIYAASLMLSRTFAGKLYDRKGIRAVFLPGTLLIFSAMLLLTWLPNNMALFIAAFFYGLGFGTVQPGLQAWAIGQSPKHRRGMANATFFSFFDLGTGLGAMVFGQLSYMFGYQSIYLVSAFSVVLSICLYFFMLKKEIRAV